MQYSSGIDFLIATKNTRNDKHVHKSEYSLPRKNWYILPNHSIYSFGEGTSYSMPSAIFLRQLEFRVLEDHKIWILNVHYFWYAEILISTRKEI